jgi:NTP pyrophosphatase (non-canonical NTP hydrolase)
MDDNTTTIEEAKSILKEFIDERDWEQFHKPKEVALALSVEVAEILEHFVFKSKEQVEDKLADPKVKEEIEDEIADSFAYLIDLARVCDVDLMKAYERKMEKNRKKYPKELVKGKNHKYTYYSSGK